MSPIGPVDVSITEQAKVGFMNQGGGLKRVAGPFDGHLLPGHAAKLVVDQRPELLSGTCVTATGGVQKLRDWIMC